MKAISIVPGTTDVELKDFLEPTIDSPTQVKIKIIEVGLCGKIVKKLKMEELIRLMVILISSSVMKCLVRLLRPDERCLPWRAETLVYSLCEEDGVAV
jgi:hypothetical protein